MAVYVINIGLILFWGMVLLHVNPSKEKKIVYCTICAIQWILISGLRDWSVGSDTKAYASSFNGGLNTSWSTVLSNCWNYLFNGLKIKDPGYYLLQKIFQIFSDNYQMWLIFIAALFTGLMARWIYKYSSMPDISFLIYSVLFYSFFAVTGHRQTIATALIVFLGYEYAKKRQFVKFAIVAFIAFMIHKSSAVFIVYYFVANISFTPTYFLVIAGVTILAGLLGSRLYAPVAYFLGFDDRQIEGTVGGAETYATVLLLLCAVSFCMYMWIKRQRVDSKYIYNMLFLTMVTTVLIYHNQGFMRVQQYFSLVIMLIVPEIIQAIDKNYRVIAYLFVVLFLTAYLIRNNPHYSFFFM